MVFNIFWSTAQYYYTPQVFAAHTTLTTISQQIRFLFNFDIDPQGDIIAQLVLNHLTILEDSISMAHPHISVDKI